MPKRLCSHCNEMVDKLDWQRHRDSHRGTRRERGIGLNHEALARELAKFPGHFTCAVCGQYPPGGQHLTVGHKVSRASFRYPLHADDPSNLQPECARCNYSKKTD